MIGWKVAAGAVGVLTLAVGIQTLRLNAAQASEKAAVVVRDEALAKNAALAEGLARVTAENERRGRIAARNRRQTNALSVQVQSLQADLAAVAQGAAPDDCINTAPPPAVRMLLSGNTRPGGGAEVRPGAAPRATSGTDDAR